MLVFALPFQESPRSVEGVMTTMMRPFAVGDPEDVGTALSAPRSNTIRSRTGLIGGIWGSLVFHLRAEQRVVERHVDHRVLDSAVALF